MDIYRVVSHAFVRNVAIFVSRFPYHFERVEGEDY